MGQVQRVAPPGAVAKKNDFKTWMENTVARELATVATKHLPADRLVRVALAAWSQNPKLRQCSQNSFLLSLLRAAQLGLDPSGALGQAYLVPYGDTCQLIVGYRGLIALARRSGEIETLEAHVAFEADRFVYRLGLEPLLEHEPCTVGDRGAVVAAYAIARFKGGGYQIEVMSKNDIDQIMQNTQSRGRSGPWRDHYPEMARKTVVRRLSKFLPLNAELADAIEHDNSVEFGRGPMVNATPADPNDQYHADNQPLRVIDAPDDAEAHGRGGLLNAIAVLQESDPEGYRRVIGRKNPFSANEDQLRAWIQEIQDPRPEEEEGGGAAEEAPAEDRLATLDAEESEERERLIMEIRNDLKEHPGLKEVVDLPKGKTAEDLTTNQLQAISSQIDRLLADAAEAQG